MTPVLQREGVLQIQRLVDGRLAGYSSIDDDERVTKIEPFRLETKSAVLYGFFLSRTSIIFDTGVGLANFLRSVQPLLSERKALAKSISAFVDRQPLQVVHSQPAPRQSVRPNDDGRPYGGTSDWTDERVDVLKRLWSEGLSASQIAQRLGGVSRNNVIGKVHRLSLPGRAKSGGSLASQRAAARIERHQRGPNVEPREYRPAVNVVVPIARRLSLGQLTEQTCHWPVGDPLEEDFHFCGLEVSPSSPYCPYHSKLAYQPAKDVREREIGSTDTSEALAENVTAARFGPRTLSPLATVATLKASAKK